MENTSLGFMILGSITAVLAALAIVLSRGKREHEKHEAEKKADFKKNFLKVNVRYKSY